MLVVRNEQSFYSPRPIAPFQFKNAPQSNVVFRGGDSSREQMNNISWANNYFFLSYISSYLLQNHFMCGVDVEGRKEGIL